MNARETHFFGRSSQSPCWKPREALQTKSYSLIAKGAKPEIFCLLNTKHLCSPYLQISAADFLPLFWKGWDIFSVSRQCSASCFQPAPLLTCSKLWGSSKLPTAVCFLEKKAGKMPLFLWLTQSLDSLPQLTQFLLVLSSALSFLLHTWKKKL